MANRHAVRNKSGKFVPNPANIGKPKRGKRPPIVRPNTVVDEQPRVSLLDTMFTPPEVDKGAVDEPRGRSPKAGAAAVSDLLGGGGSPSPDKSSTVDPGAFTMNWAIVVGVGNQVLKSFLDNPNMAMKPEEETAIATALDAVIVKHWPEMKQAGPEAALALALGAYLIRVYMEVRKARAVAPTVSVDAPGASPEVDLNPSDRGPG